MFNLDQSITEWRRKMISAGIKSSDVLDELESHLRDDVERRMRDGATAEQAFRDAVIQVGTAEQLRPEFGKVSKPQARLSRTAVRVGCVGAAVFQLFVQGWYILESDISLAERMASLAWVTAIALFVGSIPYLNRLASGVPGWAWRRGIVKISFVLSGVWSCVLLMNIANLGNFPPGTFLNSVGWSLYFATAVVCVILGYGTEPELLNPWTPAVCQSFELAGVEAEQFGHDFIGTEHLLLGLLSEENGKVTKLLGNFGVRREVARAEIEKIVASWPQPHKKRPMACTPRAMKACKIAIREAKAVGAVRAETEHVLFGLLCQGGGVAAIVLEKFGVNAAKVREQLQSNQNDSHE